MARVKAVEGQTIYLGLSGENEATEIVFDISDLLREYPQGHCELLVRKPYVSQALPVPVVQTENEAVWTVTDSDLVTDGNGEAQLLFYCGNVCKRRNIYKTCIDRSLGNMSGDVSKPDGWINDIVRVGADARKSADEAELASKKYPYVGEDGFWYVWNIEKNTFVKNVKAQGPQGPQGPAVPVDSEMSDNSANAVQNKAVKKYVDDLIKAKYELIESAVMKETGAFSRTKEPDGTPYNFKSLIVRVSTKTQAPDAYGGTYVKRGNEPSPIGRTDKPFPTDSCAFFGSVETNGMVVNFMSDVNNYSAENISDNFAQPILVNPYIALDVKPITEFGGSCYYAKDAVIEIWGIRA